jgi:hypothetical protein
VSRSEPWSVRAQRLWWVSFKQLARGWSARAGAVAVCVGASERPQQVGDLVVVA